MEVGTANTAAVTGTRPAPSARVGVLGIGLEAYWPQFEGLRERVEGYQRRVEERVRAWAELEAECCPFLTLAVDAAGSVVTLRIDGPPEASGIIDELLPRPC